MKKMRSLFALAIACALSASAQSEADTIITVDSPRQVTVTKTAETTCVNILGSRNDKNFNYSYTVATDSVTTDNIQFNLPFTSKTAPRSNRTLRSVDGFRGIYVGMVFPQSDPDPMKLSFEIGINEVIGYSIRRHGAEFNFGLGLGYRGVAIGKNNLTEKEGDALLLTPAPDGATDCTASIQNYALHIPLLYTQRIHRSFGFSLGVVANLNIHTSADMSYHLGDTKYSRTFKGLHQRLLTPDRLLTVGAIDNAGIYLRWSPVKPFKSIYGPGYTTLSLGFSLGF